MRNARDYPLKMAELRARSRLGRLVFDCSLWTSLDKESGFPAPISSTEFGISTTVFRSASPRGEPWLRVAIATTRSWACGALS